MQVRRRLLAWLPVEMRLLPSDCDQLNPREQPPCSKELKKKKKGRLNFLRIEKHIEKSDVIGAATEGKTRTFLLDIAFSRCCWP